MLLLWSLIPEAPKILSHIRPLKILSQILSSLSYAYFTHEHFSFLRSIDSRIALSSLCKRGGVECGCIGLQIEKTRGYVLLFLQMPQICCNMDTLLDEHRPFKEHTVSARTAFLTKLFYNRMDRSRRLLCK